MDGIYFHDPSKESEHCDCKENMIEKYLTVWNGPWLDCSSCCSVLEREIWDNVVEGSIACAPVLPWYNTGWLGQLQGRSSPCCALRKAVFEQRDGEWEAAPCWVAEWSAHVQRTSCVRKVWTFWCVAWTDQFFCGAFTDQFCCVASTDQFCCMASTHQFCCVASTLQTWTAAAVGIVLLWIFLWSKMSGLLWIALEAEWVESCGFPWRQNGCWVTVPPVGSFFLTEEDKLSDAQECD